MIVDVFRYNVYIFSMTQTQPTNESKAMSGKATYTNKVTGESYKLGFELSEGETELSKAWDLVEFAARRNGWNKYDVAVKAGV